MSKWLNKINNLCGSLGKATRIREIQMNFGIKYQVQAHTQHPDSRGKSWYDRGPEFASLAEAQEYEATIPVLKSSRII